jgi:uncharacterized protein YkwD
MAGCAICGETDSLTRKCNYCGKEVCSSHTLPEKHNCPSVQAANDAGKHFESAFEGTVGGSANDSPESMDKGKIRTYGTEEAVENLDSSPPVETKSGDDHGEETVEAQNRSQVRSIVGSIFWAPIVVIWTLGSALSSVLSVRVLFVCLVGIATVGQLGFVGIPGFPIDTSTAESAIEDAGAPLSNTSGGTTQTAPSETARASTQSSSSDNSGPFGHDLNRTRVEHQIHQKINERRRSHGLQPINFDTDLRKIARYHSRDMAEQQYLAHTAPDGETMEDRYEKYQYSCKVSMSENRYATGAENIAYTWAFEDVLLDNGTTVYLSTEKELARFFVSQWMNSTGHRKNILKEYWENEGIGVHIVEVDEGTKVYATQNFC